LHGRVRRLRAEWQAEGASFAGGSTAHLSTRAPYGRENCGRLPEDNAVPEKHSWFIFLYCYQIKTVIFRNVVDLIMAGQIEG